jgi:16S rRNA G966 N2-methylase RsmD
MRLAARAKAGFYPTPPSVVERITGWIKQGPGPLRTLDPCCGLGGPLEQIAEYTGAKSYGIELDRHRASTSEERLTSVLRADALTARVSANAFSLLFLNPPYDQDERSRLEHRFLLQSTAWLAPKGLLIYIIPQGRYHEVTLRCLAAWYEGIRIFRFPEDEYRRFKQTVLFGVKRPRASLDPALMEEMRVKLHGALPELPPEGSPVYSLPPVSGESLLFRSGEVGPEEALPEIDHHGVWRMPEVAENLEPGKSRETVRPLMPLRQGHLAQLIAAGFINNQVLPKEGKRLLIKGRTVKSAVKLPAEDEKTEIERDVIRTTITALDEKGRWIEIGEGE